METLKRSVASRCEVEVGEMNRQNTKDLGI